MTANPNDTTSWRNGQTCRRLRTTTFERITLSAPLTNLADNLNRKQMRSETSSRARQMQFLFAAFSSVIDPRRITERSSTRSGRDCPIRYDSNDMVELVFSLRMGAPASHGCAIRDRRRVTGQRPRKEESVAVWTQ
jgi:hypothetical protein